MADKEIKIGMTVESNLEDQTKKAEKLHNNLEAAAKAASRLGGTPGSRAVAAGHRPGGMTETEYDTAKGVVGTGAGGRDFAKQAQGLGGLVRLYATFAANAFAVGAAFRALSDAMDTTNMVRGLDQLGAASGMALGSLAKQLAAASDGALSLRDAMEATAKGSAAGLSRDQMVQMADLAKKASQALGISMPDAMSRLSRGISKLEPELLDELGIYTKLEKATTDYAREVGKTATSLSDFERRQAFANAVLKEGGDKFSKINMEANPYDKLLASLKNTTQGILELVNTILSPIIKFLSESPNALMAGIATLVTLLLKQAIPALSTWKESLRDSAEAAARSAASNKEFFEAYKDIARDQAIRNLPSSVRALGDAAEEGMDKAKKIVKDGARIYNKEFNKLLKLDTEELTADHKKVLAETEKSIQASVSRAAKRGRPEEEANAKARLATFTAAAAEINTAIDSATKYNDAIDKNAPKLAKWAKLHDRLADSTELTRKKLAILVNAADNATFVGPRSAFKSMISAIGSLGDKLSLVGKVWLGFRGTMTIVAASVGFVATAFGNILGAIGLVTSALALFIDWLSDNKEKAALFTQSLNTMNEAGTSAYRTLEYLSKLDPLEKLSTASALAKSNAITEIATSSRKAFDDLQNEILGRGRIDKIVNAIYGVFGKDSETQFAKQLSINISRAINLAGTYTKQSKVRADIAALLGLEDESTIADISASLSKAEATVQKQVIDYISKTAAEAKNSAQGFKVFDDQLEVTSKAYDDLMITFKNSTPLTKFAEESIRDITKLQEAISNTTSEEGIAKLASLADNYKFLKTLPAEAARAILSVSQELKAQAQAVAEAEDKIQGYQLGIDKVSQDILTKRKEGGALVEIQNLEQALQRYRDELDKAKKAKVDLKLDAAFIKATTTFNDAFATSIKTNIQYLEIGLTQAMAKASISVSKATLALVPDEGIRAKESEKLTRRSISLDIEQVRLNASLIDSQKDLRLAILENTYAINLSRAKQDEKNKGKSETQIIKESEELTQAKGQIEAYKKFAGKSLTELGGLTDTRDRGGHTVLSKAEQAAVNELLPFAQSVAASKSKMAELEAALKGSHIADIVNDIADQERKYNKALDDRTKDLENRKKAFDLEKGGMSEKEIAEKQLGFSTEAANLARSKAIGGAAFNVERAKAYEKLGGVDSATVLKNAKDRLDTETGIADTTEKTTVDLEKQTKSNQQILKDNQRLTDLMQLQHTLESAKASAKSSELTNTIELLNTQHSMGLITIQEYETKSKIYALNQLDLDTTTKKADIQSKLNIDLANIDAQLNQAKQLGLSKDEVDFLEKKKKLLEDIAAIEKKSVDENSQAKRQILELQYSMNEEQKAYAQAFSKSIDGMTDAFVQFAETGKLSFKSLANSLIADLARIAIRAQMVKLVDNMFGPGWASAAGKFLGNVGAGSITSPSSKAFFDTQKAGFNTWQDPMQLVYAKGGAFDSGVEKFAQGGTFTNSIVTSPTLFKFAQGTGLMGEAGPEAIMPLTRDSSGNLGVRGGQHAPQTTVTVNNYGSDKATTKETTDSRGNRNIEVIIGEMVASEVSRSGSTTQQALGNTFGNRPAMVRR